MKTLRPDFYPRQQISCARINAVTNTSERRQLRQQSSALKAEKKTRESTRMRRGEQKRHLCSVPSSARG